MQQFDQNDMEGVNWQKKKKKLNFEIYPALKIFR